MGWFNSSRTTALAAVIATGIAGAALGVSLTTHPALTPIQNKIRVLNNHITELKASNAEVRAEFDRVQATQARDGLDAAIHILPGVVGATPAFAASVRAAKTDAKVADRLYAQHRWAAADSAYEKAAHKIVAHCPARLIMACTALLSTGPLFSANHFP